MDKSHPFIDVMILQKPHLAVPLQNVRKVRIPVGSLMTGRTELDHEVMFFADLPESSAEDVMDLRYSGCTTYLTAVPFDSDLVPLHVVSLI